MKPPMWTTCILLTRSGNSRAAPARVSPLSRLLPSRDHPLGLLHMPHLAHLADRMAYPHLYKLTSPPSPALPRLHPRSPSHHHCHLVVSLRMRVSLTSQLQRHRYQHVCRSHKIIPPLLLKLLHQLGNVNFSEAQGFRRRQHARLD